MNFDLRMANLIGTQAVAAFLCALAFLMVVVSAAWLLPRRRRPSSSAPVAHRPVLAVYGVVVLALAVGALLLFFEMAEASRAQESMRRFDVVLAQTLGQNVSPTSLNLFGAATHLGDPATLTVLGLVVAVALWAFRQRPLAVFWVAALVGSGGINRLLKNLYQRSRPSADLIHLLPSRPLVDGWSFPSGHTSGAVVAYGALAYILMRTVPSRWHLPVVLLATAIAFTVASSRVIVQAHWASDVVAGAISGLIWLAVCVWAINRWMQR